MQLKHIEQIQEIRAQILHARLIASNIVAYDEKTNILLRIGNIEKEISKVDKIKRSVTITAHFKHLLKTIVVIKNNINGLLNTDSYNNLTLYKN